MTLKIKFSDFSQQTRSKTLDHYPDESESWQTALELLQQEPVTKAVRLLGIGWSNLSGGDDLPPYWEQLQFPFFEKLIP